MYIYYTREPSFPCRRLFQWWLWINLNLIKNMKGQRTILLFSLVFNHFKLIQIRCKREYHFVACFVDFEPLDWIADSACRHHDRSVLRSLQRSVPILYERYLEYLKVLGTNTDVYTATPGHSRISEKFAVLLRHEYLWFVQKILDFQKFKNFKISTDYLIWFANYIKNIKN